MYILYKIYIYFPKEIFYLLPVGGDLSLTFESPLIRYTVNKKSKEVSKRKKNTQTNRNPFTPEPLMFFLFVFI